MHGSLVLCLLALAGWTLAVDRNGRWFNREVRTVTKTVREKQVITEATPSSCVVVQTSLPPCRHLRAVNIQPSQPARIMQTEAPAASPSVTSQGWKPLLQPSDPVAPLGPGVAKATTPVPPATTPASSWGWGNIFNLGPREVVITQTIHEIYTTKYMDPNTVVTFSVKGCRPSRLPFDLPECQPPRTFTPATAPDVPEKGIIVMAPIQFVPPMAPLRTPEPVKEEKKEEVKEKEEKDKEKKEGEVKKEN